MDAVAAPPLESHLARFKLSSFRPGQREVIEEILAGQDCLVIMPTGGGKSLCYQLPAVAREGLTLVVSPLIALMKDQVDGLTALGIAATYINSSLAPAEAFRRMDQMAAGEFDLVYIAPERLRSSLFLEKLRATHVQLLAVDEAHCISEWGHDFRPDYARLGRLRQRLNNPQTIALTATATPDVRTDIVHQLELRQPRTFITGFSRPNLRFEVEQVNSDAERDRVLLDFLSQTPGAGIIYSATRKNCEALAPLLAAASGRTVDLYHAGLEPDARRRVQESFMSGQTPIIVATNAFGMGIDKPDLRFVVHYNIPGTLEAYYQEAGRAGRDGQPSRCLLLYAYRDRRIQEYFIESAYPEPEIVQQVYDFLRAIDDDPIELTLDEIRERLNLQIRSEGVAACEKLLENCGALERLDARQNMAAVRLDSDLPTLVDLLPKVAKVQRRVLQAVEKEVGGLRYERVYVNPRKIAQMAEVDVASANGALRELAKLEAFDFVPPFRGRAVHMVIRNKPFEQLGIDFEEQQRRKRAEYAKLERMIRYASAHGCRQLEILDYFGDPNRKTCAACDNCQRGERTTKVASVGGQHGADHPASSPAVVEAVRIVLSGVARMKGRFGKQMVARMLVGSQAKEISKFKLDKLSTFGLLAYLTEPQAIAFIDALLTAGLLCQVEERPHRPLLRLTQHGEEVMKGNAALIESLAIDAMLLARLVGVRPRDSAASTRLAPSPKTRPSRVASPEESGSDEPNTDFFAAANAELAAMDDELPASAIARAPASGENHAPYYWTWRVLSAGFSAGECLAIRGLARAELIDHLLRAAAAGQAVDPRWVLTADQQTALNRIFANGHTPDSVALPSSLPVGLTLPEAELYLLIRSTHQPDAQARS